MKILALDPGGTTGWTSYDSTDDAWDRGQLGPEPHHYELYSMVNWPEGGRWDAVVYERFVYQRRELTQGVSLVLDSVEYIGVLKLSQQETINPPLELVPQTPTQAKNLWDDKKLKVCGLYTAGMPHANDSTRHLLYYLTVTLGDKRWIMATRPTES